VQRALHLRFSATRSRASIRQIQRYYEISSENNVERRHYSRSSRSDISRHGTGQRQNCFSADGDALMGVKLTTASDPKQ
jgi:hypothetical protein